MWNKKKKVAGKPGKIEFFRGVPVATPLSRYFHVLIPVLLSFYGSPFSFGISTEKVREKSIRGGKVKQKREV